MKPGAAGGGESGCGTSAPSPLKHIKGPQRIGRSGARRKQEVERSQPPDPEKITRTGCQAACHRYWSGRGGVHHCPPRPWCFESPCAPSAGPQDSEPNLWSKTRCSGRILYGRWRPQHGRPAGGGAGEAQPDRRSQGDLTEFACNGPVRERRTAASPAPAPLSRILVLLPL